MDIDEIGAHVRAGIKVIPPGVRPLLLVAVPVLLLHGVFRKTPDHAPPSPEEQSVPKKIDAPPAADIRRMIEESDEFQTVKTAICVKKSDLYARENDICRALETAGYVARLMPNDPRFGLTLTTMARSQLGDDVSEDFREISVVVARKEYVSITQAFPRAQDADARLHDASRVLFQWRWVSANRFGSKLDFIRARTPMAGVAYFRRGANNLWALTEVRFEDLSPSYDWRP